MPNMRTAHFWTTSLPRPTAIALLAPLALAACLETGPSAPPSAFVQDAKPRAICKSPVEDATSRHRNLEAAQSETTDDLDGDGVRDVVVVATTKGSSPRPVRVLYVRYGYCLILVGTLYVDHFRALETSSGGLHDLEVSKGGGPPVVYRFNGFQYDIAGDTQDH